MVDKNLMRDLLRGGTPLLTRDEERDLAVAWRKRGDREAFDRLVSSNLRLVAKIAFSRKWSRAMPLEDRFQSGLVGLVVGIKRFDPDKGFRLSTYATHWIRHMIGRDIADTAHLIRIPVHADELMRGLRKEADKNGTTLAGVVAALPFKAVVARAAVRIMHIPVSLDEEREGDDGDVRSLHDVTLDPSAEEGIVALERKERFDFLRPILNRLDDRERIVLARRFGFSGEPETLKAIAKDLHLSRERVRQIQNSALRKARGMVERKEAECRSAVVWARMGQE